jgi:A/G-specific adenine glycosylase
MHSTIHRPEYSIAGRDDTLALSDKLLAWYDASHRTMPWRTSPADIKRGERPDPYRVWLSEVMLQQTTVATVAAYFNKFTAFWPTVGELAAASEEDVLKAWAGLGYYSRARNLKKCADIVARGHGGRFPQTAASLQALPGIGPYTAAAIASIAFNENVAVVDGNIERVVTRLFNIKQPLPQAKPAITKRVAKLTPPARPGDFAQAMMDLGATICTPRKPSCMICPLRGHCGAAKTGNPEIYPFKSPKKTKPKRAGAAFVAIGPGREILLRKRADSGLLAGMSEAPSSAWTANLDGATGVEAAPFNADWRRCGAVRHVFTHFELELTVYRADTNISPPPGHWWSLDYLTEALPTLMKKVIEAALGDETKGRKIRDGNQPYRL